MKLLLLSAFTLFAVSAFAQISEADLQKLTQNSSVIKKPGTSQLRLVPRQADSDSLLALMEKMMENRNNSSGKPAVKNLAPDNMPCLVPDIKASEAMPNAWRGKTIMVEPMPNPGKKEEGAGSR